MRPALEFLDALGRTRHNDRTMTVSVRRIAEQVEALPASEFDEFLSWLADHELRHLDDWDRQIERDSQPGGRLEAALDRARTDIAEGRPGPLDEIIDNT